MDLLGFVFAVILGGLGGGFVGLLLEREADKSIFKRFMELGATSPAMAVEVQKLKLEGWEKARFRRLVKKGKIKQTSDRLYYINFLGW